MRLFTVVVALVAFFGFGLAGASAQDRRLTVLVEDPSGATIPGAAIIVLSGSDLVTEQITDVRGVAVINIGTAQAVKLVVTVEGFAPSELEVTVPPRATAHQVVVAMKLANIETDVTVSATETQVEAGGLTQTLSQAEINQLPDDEEELRRMLEDIAGPGAMIRVDGFQGGRLPTRDQIARIVVRRDAFSSEFHQVGQGRVEIATRPGIERWRGNASLNVRPSQLSARNAAAQAGAKPGTLVRASAFGSGPLVKNRISITGNVEGSSSEDSRGISAITLDGPFVAIIPQNFDARSMAVRTEGLLTPTTLFRVSYERDTSERGNQGISELDLPERGYTTESVNHELRFSLEGGQRRPYHMRIQFDQNRNEALPDLVAPAIVVQSAFRRGGATVTGTDKGRAAMVDTMFTLVARPYTLRIGSLVTYDSNLQGQLRNSLGTFTFTDLESYAALLPSTFTQRRGAQPLTVDVTQGAAFIQTEFVKWRWNFGAGLRYEGQSGVGDPGGIAPRLGITRGFRRNTTNIRAGYGWFYGWMPVRIEEETMRLAQGSTEEEIIIRNPSYSESACRRHLRNPSRSADPAVAGR